MKINPITLAFSGTSRHLEVPFLNNYALNTLRQVRIAILVATLLYALYGLLDLILVPERVVFFWALRWAIVCPLMLVVLRFTFTAYYLRFMQPILCLGTMVAGLGMVAMCLLAPMEQRYTYLAGLVQILFFVYTVMRIRFLWASSIIAILFACYMVSAQAIGNMSIHQLISDTLFLLGINLMGMLACYFIEYYTRRNYYLSRQLGSKKRRLDIANQFLEERVDKRTAELTQSNQLLEIEIKERKATEKELRDSKVRYGRMVNNVTDFICVHDLDGQILEANSRMVAGLGYPYLELTTKNLRDLIVAEQRSAFDLYLKRLHRRERMTGTVTLETNEGRQRLLAFSNVLVKDTTDHDVVYSLARDITEHNRTVRALEESQARFKDIFETAAAGMMIIDGQSNAVVEINSAAAAMIGESALSIKGKDIGQLILPSNSDSHVGHAPSADPVECHLVTVDSGNLPVLKTMRPIEIDGKAHWILSFINIQKVKEAEAAKRDMESQLQRAQHLQAIGTLAGGIAHDFNNILYGVIGYTQLAMDDAPQGSTMAENLVEVLNGSYRAKELVAQILAYSRQDDAEKKLIHPKALVQEALRLLRASIPSTVEIQTDLGSRIGMIMGNPTQIHQVVMNVCTNAAHALKSKGGSIRVGMKKVTVETDEPDIHGDLRKGDYAKLVVEDSGDGMLPEVLDRIFDPFFTTKPQGEGSGMGLSVVLGIVQSHDGALRAQSAPGEGTRFEIYLPTYNAQEQTSVEHETILPTGSERVLFVDDESSIIRMGSQLLTKMGYTVTACDDAESALTLFQQNPGDFDLVITDMTMPKVTGIELAQTLLQERSDLPIILCSGNNGEITADQLKAIGIRDMLVKPILKRELAVAIRRALEPN